MQIRGVDSLESGDDDFDVAKRMDETIDKEVNKQVDFVYVECIFYAIFLQDDWLYDDWKLRNQLLNSRRRLYPRILDDDQVESVQQDDLSDKGLQKNV